MHEGSNREAVRAVAERLRAEFAKPAAGGSDKNRATPEARKVGTLESLDHADEELVGHLREALAAIAANPGPSAGRPAVQTIEPALAGAEFVIRRALADGGSRRVLELMPSLVFLVVLPAADQNYALELASRTTALIQEIVPGWIDPDA